MHRALGQLLRRCFFRLMLLAITLSTRAQDALLVRPQLLLRHWFLLLGMPPCRSRVGARAIFSGRVWPSRGRGVVTAELHLGCYVCEGMRVRARPPRQHSQGLWGFGEPRPGANRRPSHAGVVQARDHVWKPCPGVGIVPVTHS